MSVQETPDTSHTEAAEVVPARGMPATDPAPRRPRPAPQLWLLLGLGIGSILWGLLVMSLRPAALASIAVFAGLSFLVGGAAQFLLARELDGGWRVLAYIGGALGLVAGIAAFAWPGMTIAVVAVFTAWSLVVSGILRIVGTFAGPRAELWWVGLVAGLVELVLGLWAIGSPERIVLLFVNLIGLWLVVVGVDSIVMAFTRRAAWLPWVAALALAAGIVLSRDRRRAVTAAALGVAAAMAVLVVAVAIGRAAVLGRVPDGPIATATVTLDALTAAVNGTAIAVAVAALLVGLAVLPAGPVSRAAARGRSPRAG